MPQGTSNNFHALLCPKSCFVVPKVWEWSHFQTFGISCVAFGFARKTAHGHAVMCPGFVCNNDLTTEKCFPSQRLSEKLVKTFHSDFAGNCNSLSLMAPMLFAASNSLRRASVLYFGWPQVAPCNWDSLAHLYSPEDRSQLLTPAQSCASLV